MQNRPLVILLFVEQWPWCINIRTNFNPEFSKIVSVLKCIKEVESPRTISFLRSVGHELGYAVLVCLKESMCSGTEEQSYEIAVTSIPHSSSDKAC